MDRSGSVSTDEMAAMVEKLQMGLDDEQLAQLMADADPDESGEVDFDEFVGAIKEQMGAGGGGNLLGVVSGVSSLFGWLNPFAWFTPGGSRAKDTGAQSAGSAARRGLGARQAGAAHSPTPPGWLRGLPPLGQPQEEAPLRLSQIGYAQWVVQADNKLTAEEMRGEEQSRRAFAEEQRARFLAKQQERIREIRAHERQGNKAAEQLKVAKREVGTQMVQGIKAAYQYKQQKEAYDAYQKASKVARAKRTQQHKKSARRRASEAAALHHEHSEARARRKEESLATKRLEYKELHAQTAKVRHETRPEVRQEGRDMFQRQRDTAAATVADATAENLDRIAFAREQFVRDSEEKRQQVLETDMQARQARTQLAAERRRDADEVRRKLAAERERKRQLGDESRQSTQEQHHVVFESRFASDEAVEQVRLGPQVGTPSVTARSLWEASPQSTAKSTGRRSAPMDC